MNLGTAFYYPFKDPKWWLKAFIACICSSLVVTAPCTVGYGLRTVRHAAHDQPLPEWKDWGGLFVDGLRVIALGLGYMLPALLLMIVTAVSAAFLGPLSLILGLIAMVLGIMGTVRSTIAYMFLVPENGTLSAAFDFGAVTSILHNHKWLITKFLIFIFITNAFFKLVCNFSLTLVFSQIMPEWAANYLALSILSPLILFITAALYAQVMHKLSPVSLDE